MTVVEKTPGEADAGEANAGWKIRSHPRWPSDGCETSTLQASKFHELLVVAKGWIWSKTTEEKVTGDREPSGVAG